MGDTKDTRLRVMKDTRDDLLRPLQRDNETWDSTIRRIAKFYRDHGGDEDRRVLTEQEVRQIVREEVNDE